MSSSSSSIVVDEQQQKQFLDATRSGHVADIEKCLENNISSPSSFPLLLLSSSIEPLTGNSALHIAAAHGSLQVTRFFMNKLDQNDEQQQKTDSTSTTSSTTSKDSIINKINKVGETPISLACQNSHYHVVKELLDHGANPNQLSEKSGLHTALFDAVTSVHITKLLLDYHQQGHQQQSKCDVNHRDKYGNTALHFAAVKDKTEGGDVVKLLLERGSDVNAKNSIGQTPLDNASASKNTTVVEILKQHIAKISPSSLSSAATKDVSSLSLHPAAKGSSSNVSSSFFDCGGNNNNHHEREHGKSNNSVFSGLEGQRSSVGNLSMSTSTSKVLPHAEEESASSFVEKPRQEKGSSSSEDEQHHHDATRPLLQLDDDDDDFQHDDDDQFGGGGDFGAGQLKREKPVCFN